jgi:hypothetical protein
MIAYKLVVEKENKFYPLVNFGINGWMGETNFPPYELNKTYEYKGEGEKYLRKHPLSGEVLNKKEQDGFHFWADMGKIKLIEQWNEYFRRKNKKERINAILRCNVDKIKWIGFQNYERPHKKIIASTFTPLEVIRMEKI